MILPFSLLPFFITLVNSVWSDEIGGPLLGLMGGFPQFGFTLRGCYICSVVRPVFPFNSFPVSVFSDWSDSLFDRFNSKHKSDWYDLKSDWFDFIYSSLSPSFTLFKWSDSNSPSLRCPLAPLSHRVHSCESRTWRVRTLGWRSEKLGLVRRWLKSTSRGRVSKDVMIHVTLDRRTKNIQPFQKNIYIHIICTLCL